MAGWRLCLACLDMPWWCIEPLNTVFTTPQGTRWTWACGPALPDCRSTFWGLSLSEQWIRPYGLTVHTLLKGNRDADSELKSNLLGWINSDVTSCMSVKLHLVQDLYMPSTSLNLLLSPVKQPRRFCEENHQGQNTSIPQVYRKGQLDGVIKSPLVLGVSKPSAECQSVSNS